MQSGCEKASFPWACEVNGNSWVGTYIASAEEIIISVERKNGSPGIREDSAEGAPFASPLEECLGFGHRESYRAFQAERLRTKHTPADLCTTVWGVELSAEEAFQAAFCCHCILLSSSRPCLPPSHLLVAISHLAYVASRLFSC